MNSKFIALIFFAACGLCAEDTPLEIRVAQKTVLLTRGGKPVAAAAIRPPGAKPVLTAEGLADLLRLPAKNELSFEQLHAVKTSDPRDIQSILVYVKRTSNGVRVRVEPKVTGPSAGNLAPGERLPDPDPLEFVLQLFPGTDNKPPRLTTADNAPAEFGEKPLRSRLLNFQGSGDHRVVVGRSGPANWKLSSSENTELLGAPLLLDPHQSGQFGSFVLYFGTGADEGTPELSALSLEKAQTPAEEVVEGWARVYASGGNPYSLSDVAPMVEVALPADKEGRIPIKRLPCFFWEHAEAFEGEFRFRYAPPAAGMYGVRFAVVAPTGKVIGDAQVLRATPAVTNGFVRTKQSKLEFADGTAFTPLCSEISFAEGLTPAACAKVCREHFIKMTRDNTKVARIELNRAFFPFDRADRSGFEPACAAALDEIFIAAQARGIYLIFSIENAFDVSRGSARHPYFRELGGPLAATPEFFRNTAVKRLFQRKLSYVAARYGAFRSLLSWDLMDKIDAAWAPLKLDPEDNALPFNEADRARRARRDVEDWIDEMALHLRLIDQHNHPVTVHHSIAAGALWPGLRASENLDWFIFDANTADDSPELFQKLAKAYAGEKNQAKPLLILRVNAPEGVLFPKGVFERFAGYPIIRSAPKTDAEKEEQK